MSVRCTATAASLALLLAACGSSGGDRSSRTTRAAGTRTTTTVVPTTGPPAVAPEDNGGRRRGGTSLVMGAVLPQSGNLAPLGPPTISAAQLAERDVNAAGGVNGKAMRLVVTDDGGGSDDNRALAAVDKLVNSDKVAAIVGAGAPTTTNAIVDRVVGSGTVECSPTDTSSDVSRADDRGLYFRVPPPDPLQAQALAKVVTGDGRRKVAIIAPDTAYGAGMVGLLVPALVARKAQIRANVTYDDRGVGINVPVKRVVFFEPDAIVLVGNPDEGGRVIAELTKQGAGPADVALYVTDRMDSKTLFEQVDRTNRASTAGIRGTVASAVPRAGAAFFPAAFRAFAPQVPSPTHSAHAYDCVILVALAAQKAGSNAPYDIAREMIDVSRGETAAAEPCDTYKACLALLRTGRDIDYQGASGAIDLTDHREPSAGSFDVYTFGADGAPATRGQVAVGQ